MPLARDQPDHEALPSVVGNGVSQQVALADGLTHAPVASVFEPAAQIELQPGEMILEFAAALVALFAIVVRPLAAELEPEERSGVEIGDRQPAEFPALRKGDHGLGDGTEQDRVGGHAAHALAREGGAVLPWAGQLPAVPVGDVQHVTGQVFPEARRSGDHRSEKAIAEKTLRDRARSRGRGAQDDGAN